MTYKRIIMAPIIIGFILLGYAISFLFVIIEGPEIKIIDSLLSRWHLVKAVLVLSDFIIPLLFAASASASVFLVYEDEKPFNNIKPILIPVISLFILFSVYMLLINPVLKKIMMTTETVSSHFMEYYQKADSALKKKDSPAAQKALEVCRNIDQNEKLYIEIKDLLESAILKQNLGSLELYAPKQPEKALKGTETAETTAENWYMRALEAESKKDYYTALFYIDRSLTISPDEPAYKSMRRRIVSVINSLKPPAQDTIQGSIYSRKLKGYEALRAGDSKRAYSIYLDLSKEVPNDPDVVRYLAESLEELSKVAIFFDSAIKALNSNPSGRIFLLIRESDLEYIIAAKRAVSSNDAVWFEEFIYEVYKNKKLSTRVLAQYSRLSGNTVLLRTVDRTNPNIVFEPQWSSGKSEIPYIEIPAHTEKISRIISIQNSLPAVSIFSLWFGLNDMKNYGFDVEPLHKELLYRLSFPFASLIAILLGLAFGLNYKRDNTPAVVFLIFGTILVTACMSFIFSGISWLCNLLIDNLYLLFPGTITVIFWISISIIVILFSFLYVGRVMSNVHRY